MGNSNAEWGDIADDPERSARWDTYQALPLLPEDNPFLNTFLNEKGLSREELIRTGARLDHVGGRWALCFWFPPGNRKWRTIQGPTQRASDKGAVWSHLKIIHGADRDGTSLILAEGETDAAVLTRLAPTYDVGILPAGAKTFTTEMVAQCNRYAVVLAGLDRDEAGDEGSDKILTAVPHARRLRPPDGTKDWCDAAARGYIPEDWVPVPEERERSVFSIRELLAADLGTTADTNWLADGVAPVGGEIVIHGPLKSMKSVLLMEFVRSIATGSDFAGYIPFIHEDGPGRVLLIQMEIPPHGFQRRMEGMVAQMGQTEAAMFAENVFTLGVADNSLPRLKVSSPDFRGTVLRAVDESGADVVAIDPLQRIVAGYDIDKPNEIQPLFDLVEELMDNGLTVVYTHHNNKASRNEGTPYSMSGTQRLGADADAICSVYHDAKAMLPDDNTDAIKQRNFVWTLRSGAARARSMTASPSREDPEFMNIVFGEPFTPTPKPDTTSPTTTQPSIT